MQSPALLRSGDRSAAFAAASADTRGAWRSCSPALESRCVLHTIEHVRPDVFRPRGHQAVQSRILTRVEGACDFLEVRKVARHRPQETPDRVADMTSALEARFSVPCLVDKLPDRGRCAARLALEPI